jgi:hypothetical protein
MKTIFVSMATLKDSETEKTLNNIFSAAKYPERIFVGISCIMKDTNSFKKIVNGNKNVRVTYTEVTKKNAAKVIGVGKGRYVAESLYNGEDYFLQIDSHTLLNDSWDEYMINLFEEAVEEVKSRKIVMTNYLPRYRYFPERSAETDDSSYSYYVPRQLYFGFCPMFWDSPLKYFTEQTGKIYDKKFYPAAKFSAHCAFGDKNFAKNTGLYKEAYFYDEEIVQSINLIDDGFFLVHPNTTDFPLHHLYSADISHLGGTRDYMTESLDNLIVDKIEEDAKERYLNLLKNNKEKVKKYEKYAKINLKLGAFNKYHVPEHYDWRLND